MSLDITIIEKAPGTLNVTLKGALDTNTYVKFEKRLNLIYEISPMVIILDLEKLEYISSMGLLAIAKVKRTLEENNGSIALVNMQPQIREVFEIIKALPHQQIFKDIRELDDYLLTRQKLSIEERGEH